jgi:predicted N-acetyltransferase YhbS
MILRQETKLDYKATEEVIRKAFETLDISDKNEHILVQKLRNGNRFIPELSIVAEIDNTVVGHILFTKAPIEGEENYVSLALAPVAVLPEYQNKGIGMELIQNGLEKAKKMGFESATVVGHPKYYPRFGFQKASRWGIKFPVEVPDEVFMAIELIPDSLKGKSGVVNYANEFGIK